MTWKEPITDRTAADVTDADTSALAAQKGTLNAEDLNRIEGNYRYIMEQLEGAAVYIPHTYRRRQEKQIQADGTVTTTTYTDWQEPRTCPGFRKSTVFERIIPLWCGCFWLDLGCLCFPKVCIWIGRKLTIGNELPQSERK